MKQTSVLPLASLISTAALAAIVAVTAMSAAPAMAQQPAPVAAPATTPAVIGPTVPTAPTAPATDSTATAGDAATAPAAATGTAAVPAAPAAGTDTTTAPNPARAQLGVPAAPYSNAATGGGLMQTTFALAFVIALLLGGAWVLKRFGPRGFGGGSNTVKLVGALSVGARERIMVVEVGDQWIVVGASPGRMNALATMPRQETPEVAPGSQPMAAPANFADWFKQTIDKRNNSNINNKQ